MPKLCQKVTSAGAGAPEGNSGPRNELCPVCRTSCWNIGQGVWPSWPAAGSVETSKRAPVKSRNVIARCTESSVFIDRPPVRHFASCRGLRIVASGVLGALNLHEDATQRWVVSKRRPASRRSAMLRPGVAARRPTWHEIDGFSPRCPDRGRRGSRAERGPQAWLVLGPTVSPCWRRWRGAATCGTVLVARGPDVPSAPSVSSHGEHSPDTDLPVWTGVILQRRGIGEASESVSSVRGRRTHAAWARPRARERRGRRADTTGLRIDLRVPAVHADDLDVERALHARIGSGATRLPGHRSARARE